jgi:hypothetical protein
MGAVHPWPTAIMEVGSFLLVIVWMGKIFFYGMDSIASRFDSTAGIWLPLTLFLSWTTLALLPLPPRMEKEIAPATYELYIRTLPGWPEKAPYADLHIANDVSAPSPVVNSSEHSGSWRSVSIQRTLTETWLLRLLAYVSVFLVVLFYPFGAGEGSARATTDFVRTVLRGTVCIGLAVAVIGVVEKATWNGKILWTFVPYDWHAPQLWRGDRARGPLSTRITSQTI